MIRAASKPGCIINQDDLLFTQGQYARCIGDSHQPLNYASARLDRYSICSEQRPDQAWNYNNFYLGVLSVHRIRN
jgi:hypothetical protein